LLIGMIRCYVPLIYKAPVFRSMHLTATFLLLWKMLFDFLKLKLSLY
jgi:hypothetical protein